MWHCCVDVAYPQQSDCRLVCSGHRAASSTRSDRVHSLPWGRVATRWFQMTLGRTCWLHQYTRSSTVEAEEHCLAFVLFLCYLVTWQRLQRFGAIKHVPSVLWRCWLGGRKGIWPVKNRVVGCRHGYLSGVRCKCSYGPAVATTTHWLLLQEIQIGFTFLVPAHPGSPGQRAIKRVLFVVDYVLRPLIWVCVCVLLITVGNLATA